MLKKRKNRPARRMCAFLCAVLCLLLVGCADDGSGLIFTPDTSVTPDTAGTADTVGTGDTTHATDTDPTDPPSGETVPSYDAAEALAPAEQAAKEALTAVPSRDFDGMTILCATTKGETLFFDDEDPTIYGRERYARVTAVNDKLNVMLAALPSTIADIQSGMKDAAASGMPYCHLCLTAAKDTAVLQGAGLLGAFSKLPFVHTEKAYYDAGYQSAVAGENGLYAIYGDACFDEGALLGVIYNRTLSDSLGLPAPETLVTDGNWTVDKMNEYAAAASASSTDERHINGVTFQDPADFCDGAYISGGFSSVSFDGGKTTLKDNRSIIADAAASMKAFWDKGLVNADPGAETIFSEGRALFYVTTLSHVENICAGKDLWGLLPVPSFVPTDTCVTPATSATLLLSYPDSAANLEEVGLLIESLNAASYRILREAAPVRYLHLYARYEDTVDMLERMLGNIGWDFCTVYGGEYPTVSRASTGAFLTEVTGGKTYASVYSSNKTAAQRTLNAYFS